MVLGQLHLKGPFSRLLQHYTLLSQWVFTTAHQCKLLQGLGPVVYRQALYFRCIQQFYKFIYSLLIVVVLLACYCKRIQVQGCIVLLLLIQAVGQRRVEVGGYFIRTKCTLFLGACDFCT